MHNIIDRADIFIKMPRRGVPYEIKNRKKICHTIYNEYSKEDKMHNKTILLTAVIFCLTSYALFGCGEVRPADVSEGTYATQQRMTAIEYNLFISKQITVFTNQLMSRIAIIHGEEKMSYPQELNLAKSSRREMQEALDSVITAYPSTGDDENRKTTISAMQGAIDDMDKYIEAVEKGEDVQNFKTIFQNDFNGLTQQAGLYNQ